MPASERFEFRLVVPVEELQQPTLYRRFELSQGRDPVPGGEYELTNGMVFGIDLGVGG